MKGFAVLASFLISFSSLFAQNAPPIEWQKCLGGSGDDNANSVCQTPDGSFIIVGSTSSSDGDITFNHGYYDYWIVKLDASGNIIWQKSLGGSDDDKALVIRPTAPGGYIVAGETASTDEEVTGNHGGYDCWVVKLDETGNIIWQKSLGGSAGESASSIEQTIDGGYIVAGGSNSNDGDVSGHHGSELSSDYWVIRLDSSGNIKWQKSIGGTEIDFATSIKPTSDMGFIVGGYSTSKDGDVYDNYGGWDCWVVKLDSTGNIEWQKNFGGTSQDNVNDIVQTLDGSFLVTSWTFSNDADVSGNHGEAESWISKLSSTGDIIWSKCFGGSSGDNGYSIRQTADSGFIVAGYSNSNDGDVSGNHGSADFWIFKLDSSGTIIWQELLGGSNVDQAFSIDQTDDGGFVTAGTTFSNDGQVSGYHEGNDCWVVKLQGTTGIHDFRFVQTLLVFPNPASDLITLQLQSQTTITFETTITISNLLGETLLEKPSHCINGNLQETIFLDEKFSSGIYFVKVSSDRQQWSAPLVVEK